MNSTTPYKLSLIIPCYNEEKTLHTCVQRCLELKKSDLNLELIIVDDCSRDESLAVARKLATEHPEITVLHHAVNQGKGAALRTGLLQATGDYVGIQDADMEYEPLDYITLLKPLLEGKADVVYGSRYLRNGTRRVLYFWHTWMNRTLTFVSNMFTNLDISDMETCYKLFRRDIIQNIAPQLKENRFGFEPEVTARVAQLKCRVYECAIHYTPRTYEEGKKIGWKDGVHAMYCILHYGGSKAPLPMQILLYFLIGGFCAVLNVALFSFMLGMGAVFSVSVITAFWFAAAVNYLLCIAILFRHKARWSSKAEVLAYVLCVCLMCVADYAVTAGLMHLSFSPGWSKAWASVIGFIGNFVARKYVVFYEK